MNISLQTVRETLRSAFGPDSFIASFIASVEASDSRLTAGITARADHRRGAVMRPKTAYEGTLTVVINRKIAIRWPRKAALSAPESW